MKVRRQRSVVLALSLVAALVARFSSAQTLQGGPPATITQPAHVEPYEQAEILAKAAGFVSRLYVDIGDRVEKDQVLAELWIPEMDQDQQIAAAAVHEAESTVRQMEAAVEAATARLHEQQAGVAQYQAELDYRRSEHDRVAHLVAERALNEALLDEQRSQLRSAEAALVAAQAAVVSADANVNVAYANLSHAQARQRLAEANLEKTEVLRSYAQIRAPFDGVVTYRGIDPGDFVASAASNATEPLFTVCSVSRLRIIVDVPESQAPRIRLGQSVTLAVDAIKDKTFRGTVKRTAGVLDPRTRTLRVEAELDAPNAELRPGMFGSLTITLAPSGAGG